MVNLRVLDVSNTSVKDAGLQHLRELVNLTQLTLSDTCVTDAGLEHLEAMRDLNLLDLTRTQLTDDGLEHLKGLTNLKRLDLHGTAVTDNGLKHLRGLTNLERLFLSLTHVSAPGLDHLDGLTNLKSLDLRFTQVTDADVRHWRAKQPGRISPLTARLDDRGVSSGFSAATGTAELRDGKWKFYARTLPRSVIELYDWSKDPRELNNVADDHPELVARFLSELRRHMSRGSGSSRKKDEWLRQHGTH
jgi:hypothetical protein